MDKSGFFFKHAGDVIDFLSKLQIFANSTGSEGKEAAEKVLLKLSLHEPLEVTPIRQGKR